MKSGMDLIYLFYVDVSGLLVKLYRFHVDDNKGCALCVIYEAVSLP